MLRSVLPALALLFSASGVAHAQDKQSSDDRWQLTLDGEHYVWDVRLVRLEGDSLLVRGADSLSRIPVGRITELRLIRKSEARRAGDGGAGAMAALVGADDELYDLTPLEFADRLRAVQKILLYRPAEP